MTRPRLPPDTAPTLIDTPAVREPAPVPEAPEMSPAQLLEAYRMFCCDVLRVFANYTTREQQDILRRGERLNLRLTSTSIPRAK